MVSLWEQIVYMWLYIYSKQAWSWWRTGDNAPYCFDSMAGFEIQGHYET